MKVCELVETIKDPVTIEFRNSKDDFVCKTKSDSEGVEPYWARTVLKWFPFSNYSICILLEDEKPESWHSDWTEDYEM